MEQTEERMTQSEIINSRQALCSMAADYALSHGLVVNDKTTAAVVHAPVTLFPSPFPKTCFEEAYRLQPLFNDLVERMANSDAFITDSLERVVKSDEFTKRLLDIYNQVKGLEHRQVILILEAVARERCLMRIDKTIRLGIHRSDYMLDVSPSGISSIKQVELNTISSSFSSLSALVSQLHTYLVSVSDDWKSSDGVLSQQSPRPHLPPNESLHSVAKGLTKAWELYNDTKAIVIMVVQPNEGNIYDQRWIEYELFEKYSPKRRVC